VKWKKGIGFMEAIHGAEMWISDIRDDADVPSFGLCMYSYPLQGRSVAGFIGVGLKESRYS
jgi:hypothetical protein